MLLVLKKNCCELDDSICLYLLWMQCLPSLHILDFNTIYLYYAATHVVSEGLSFCNRLLYFPMLANDYVPTQNSWTCAIQLHVSIQRGVGSADPSTRSPRCRRRQMLWTTEHPLEVLDAGDARCIGPLSRDDPPGLVAARKAMEHGISKWKDKGARSPMNTR
jgi:hypothetical protein